MVVLLWLFSFVQDAAAVRPADLAPGAPELQEAELRLVNLLDEADAVRAATSRLQARWVALGEPIPLEKGKTKAVDPCDAARLDVAWRIEHFGAAWREAAQAAHAEADRLQLIRTAATVAPLVDNRWTDRLRGLLDQDALDERAFVEASVWQAQFVRPVLQSCSAKLPASPPALPKAVAPGTGPLVAGAAADAPATEPPNGEALAFTWERGHRVTPVAVLAENEADVKAFASFAGGAEAAAAPKKEAAAAAPAAASKSDSAAAAPAAAASSSAASNFLHR